MKEVSWDEQRFTAGRSDCKRDRHIAVIHCLSITLMSSGIIIVDDFERPLMVISSQQL